MSRNSNHHHPTDHPPSTPNQRPSKRAREHWQSPSPHATPDTPTSGQPTVNDRLKKPTQHLLKALTGLQLEPLTIFDNTPSDLDEGMKDLLKVLRMICQTVGLEIQPPEPRHHADATIQTDAPPANKSKPNEKTTPASYAATAAHGRQKPRLSATPATQRTRTTTPCANPMKRHHPTRLVIEINDPLPPSERPNEYTACSQINDILRAEEGAAGQLYPLHPRLVHR
ncbi:hypothetical protein BD410DRAFT_836196 [Rickenella mellea]|uniref:Uncharacterized protein n=1 Tax=Rickenella mellea TaxID=50990 RepID=A0A4Y7QI62_9AGAM|nr:hypothetical protein BD410DRAFT_836196 [Rickenella mellea]